MSTQLALPLEDVPVTCPIQRRYHVIAPLLAGRSSITEQAQAFSLGYSTVSRWVREFRERGMPGRVIGTLRRECLDHVVVFHEPSLSRHLRSFLDYYHHTRCPLELARGTGAALPRC